MDASTDLVTFDDVIREEKLSRHISYAEEEETEEDGDMKMSEVDVKESISTDSAFESSWSESQTTNSEASSFTKDVDYRVQDFQLLRKYESEHEKTSPFVSSELDEFLIRLNKDRPINNNAVIRPGPGERSTSASDDNETSSSRFRRPLPQPTLIGTNQPNATSSATTAAAMPSQTPDSLRKRHANLPEVIQKYMRMSKKSSLTVEEAIREPMVESVNAATTDSLLRQTCKTVKSGPKSKVTRGSGKKPTGRSRQVLGPSVSEESSRSSSPSSPLPNLTIYAIEADDFDADSGCARTAIPYPLVKSTLSSDCLNEAGPFASQPRHSNSDDKLTHSKSQPIKSTAFKSLIRSHDLGPHGDLVYVRRPTDPSKSSRTSTTTKAIKSKGAPRLFHIHADEPGWKVEKQSILGAIMRVQHRLKSVQTSVSFQQRRWSVEVKLHDSAKEKPFRVKFPRNTLPRSADDNDADDVDVVFVRILSSDSVLDGAPEPADNWEPESQESSMAGIAIIETKSLSQKQNEMPMAVGDEKNSNGLQDQAKISREEGPKEKIAWCRRRSIGTQVVTLLHSESQAVFLGGQSYALKALGIHPCDPVAEVEEMMTRQKECVLKETSTDRSVQSAVNLETINCELAETQEKLVSLMGTTADPVPTDLPNPLSPDPPPIVDCSNPPKLVIKPQLQPSIPSLRLPLQNQSAPLPPLIIRVPAVGLRLNELASASIRVPDICGGDVVANGGISPEILLVNTGECQGLDTSTKSSITPHIVADVSGQSMTQNPTVSINSNLSNMRINNPGSTVLPVQILPQGLIQLPPGTKVIYSSGAPSQPLSTPVISAVGSLRNLRPVIQASGIHQPPARIPLLFPVGTNTTHPRIPVASNQTIIFMPPPQIIPNQLQAKPLNAVLRNYIRSQAPTTPDSIAANSDSSQSPSVPSSSHTFSPQIVAVSPANVQKSSPNLMGSLKTSLVSVSSAQSTSLSVSSARNWKTCSPRIITVSSNEKLKDLLSTYSRTLHSKEQQRQRMLQLPLNKLEKQQLLPTNNPSTHLINDFQPQIISPSSMPNLSSVITTPMTTITPKCPVLVAPLRVSSSPLSPTAPFPISLVAKSQLRVLPAKSLASASHSCARTKSSLPILEAVGSLSKFPASLSQASVISNLSPPSTTSAASVTPELQFTFSDPLQSVGRPPLSPDCIAIEDEASTSPRTNVGDQRHIGSSSIFSGGKDDPVVLG